MKRWRGVLDHRLTVAVVAGVVALVFTLHFAMIALHLSPFNPVKLALNPYLALYVNPLFVQNWHLFAPNPVATSMSLLGKCQAGGVESGWLDLTQGLTDRLGKAALFGAASSLPTLLFFQLNLSRAYLYGFVDPDPMLVEVCVEEPQLEFCRTTARQNEDVRQASEASLTRVVSDACANSGFPNVERVFIRIADLEFPRFSSRSNPDRAGTVGYVDVGWRRVHQ